MNAQTKVENANLAIWNAVSKTDPAHTKKVNQRGGFTAISAHYQILAATEQFGPVGVGWGYTNGEPIFHDTLVFVPVTIWHGERCNTFGPVYGGAEWKNNKGFLDSDAIKKASTDGLTKALSQLGFNADVFLGRFDDNKYVEQVRREFAEQAEAANDQPEKVQGITKIKERLRELQIKGDAATDLETLNALIHGAADDLTKIKDGKHDWWTGDGGEMEGFKAWIVRRRAELSPDNMVSRMIADMKECSTRTALSRWLGANNDVIEQLDGADARRFQLACDLHESALGAEATVTAG
jgi:hypothetical protein